MVLFDVCLHLSPLRRYLPPLEFHSYSPVPKRAYDWWAPLHWFNHARSYVCANLTFETQASFPLNLVHILTLFSKEIKRYFWHNKNWILFMSPAFVNSTTLRWCLAYISVYQKKSPRGPKISGPGSTCHLGEWKSNKVVRFCYSSKEYTKMLLGFISWYIKDWSCHLPYCTVLISSSLCFVSCSYLYGDFCFYRNKRTGPLTFPVNTFPRAQSRETLSVYLPSLSLW